MRNEASDSVKVILLFISEASDCSRQNRWLIDKRLRTFDQQKHYRLEKLLTSAESSRNNRIRSARDRVRLSEWSQQLPARRKIIDYARNKLDWLNTFSPALQAMRIAISGDKIVY